MSATHSTVRKELTRNKLVGQKRVPKMRLWEEMRQVVGPTETRHVSMMEVIGATFNGADCSDSF